MLIRTNTNRRARHRRPAPGLPLRARAGFSLFEVVIALAIFVVSIAAIGQLVSSGVRGAVRSRLQTQAVMRGESKMAELVAGVASLQSASNTPFTDNPAWSYSVSLLPGPHNDLYIVDLTVACTGTGDLSSTSFSLRRLVRDPAVILEMEKAKEEAQAEQAARQSSSSSSTTSGSSGTSGTSGTSGGSR
ncbi:MAG: prepilin-type N-terminal cleavage/methylation domain-containing protein [Planctomycetaceae bacterium]|nr:prepilin-type N-terminal cleavage/methylation domain-containing protein [Planctomycetaceae bacterium]